MPLMSGFCCSTQLSKHKEVEQQVTPEKINCHLNTWVMFTSVRHVYQHLLASVESLQWRWYRWFSCFQFLSIVCNFSYKKVTFIIFLLNSIIKVIRHVHLILSHHFWIADVCSCCVWPLLQSRTTEECFSPLKCLIY